MDKTWSKKAAAGVLLAGALIFAPVAGALADGGDLPLECGVLTGAEATELADGVNSGETIGYAIVGDVVPCGPEIESGGYGLKYRPVVLGGKQGYIRSTNLAEVRTFEDAEYTIPRETAELTELYEFPSKNAAALKKLVPGSQLTAVDSVIEGGSSILGGAEMWVPVRTDEGVVGFVLADEVVSSTAEEPSEPPESPDDSETSAEPEKSAPPADSEVTEPHESSSTDANNPPATDELISIAKRYPELPITAAIIGAIAGAILTLLVTKLIPAIRDKFTRVRYATPDRDEDYEPVAAQDSDHDAEAAIQAQIAARVAAERSNNTTTNEGDSND